MGFLSTLGKIGAGIAAPFTGGASLAAIPAIDAFSSVLGKQQEGAAQGRKSEAEILNDRDRNATSLYGVSQNAQNAAAATDLDRKRYSDESRGSNANRAVIAALLGGGQMGGGVSVPGVRSATVTGGPLAALRNNPQALAALAELGSQSSANLTSPAAFSGGNILTAPTLSALPTQSKGSSLLDTIARLGQLAGPVIKALPKKGANGQPDDGIFQ